MKTQRLGFVAFVALLISIATPLRAQAAEPSEGNVYWPRWQFDQRWALYPVSNVSFFGPEKASAEARIAYILSDEGEGWFGGYRDEISLVGAFGQEGWRAGVQYESGSAFSSFGAFTGVLATEDDPEALLPNSDFVGAEVFGRIFFIRLSAGYYWQASSGTPEKDSGFIFRAGVGL